MSTIAKVAILASWVVTTSLGCVLIAVYWISHGPGAKTAITHSLLFAAIMTCLHAIGYQAYKHQGTGGHWSSTPLAPSYKAIRSALIQQVVIVVLALQEGITFHAALLSVVVYWAGIAVIVVRRPTAPTKGDIHFVKYGFLYIVLVIFALGPIYWAARGRP